MARERMTELRVGTFIVLGGLLAMLMIFFIGGEGKIFKRTYTLYTQFESVAGLRPGADVLLAGMRAGTVENIWFPKDLTDKQVRVALKIQRHFRDRIRTDSFALVSTQGLLGDKYVSLTVGSPDQPELKDGSLLASKEGGSISAVADKVNEVMGDVKEISSSIKAMFQGSIDSKSEGDIRASIASLRRLMEHVEKGEGLLHALVYDPQGGEMMASLSQASKSAEEILETVRTGQGTVGLLINDPAIYEDVRTLLGRTSRNKLFRAVIRATLRKNENQVLK
ncbi:MAG: hypothetical protein A3I05_03525 [Deltaproteobacteria bacterium RIFCSPLOWO2_02_FULL_44_10]|nr:MAG: hypothetical protein A3C46_03100 [Deltaproteobacteria bacterium RIFCSPHIGHO2_02_FULL_44_16]OGQ46243.1 MAG: hypothetical protein A3I05_03525 [Deltaproteobacteria bacterium RIFCSPLOWO2_02_FULL_44_10]